MCVFCVIFLVKMKFVSMLVILLLAIVACTFAHREWFFPKCFCTWFSIENPIKNRTYFSNKFFPFIQPNIIQHIKVEALAFPFEVLFPYVWNEMLKFVEYSKILWENQHFDLNWNKKWSHFHKWLFHKWLLNEWKCRFWFVILSNFNQLAFNNNTIKCSLIEVFILKLINIILNSPNQHRAIQHTVHLCTFPQYVWMRKWMKTIKFKFFFFFVVDRCCYRDRPS